MSQLTKDGHVYLDVISLMNFKQFRVTKVPLSYVTNYSVEVRDSLNQVVEPCYNPDDEETTSWRVSVVMMVDMYFNKVPFRFNSVQDMEEVYNHMATYTRWIHQFSSVPQDHKVFVSRAKPFLNFIIDKCNRIRKEKQQQGLVRLSFSDAIFNNM